ncbi:uncharacterized protein LOC100264542 isoform X2 [Vitis vinifera]|uniref:uncharacterized protein LOC100264542 isoform X2 n=1 Tax=Vitis vinifera TaxID=29760 RepID=UPI0008FEB098|nr:uncharacterized protein LOC100264542 isoform X2 [Vitis vinifera]|eukprot:XP_019078706.1 PREDICTED: TBC1 domain family member 13 isoform X2 [Vitis vinifera]
MNETFSSSLSNFHGTVRAHQLGTALSSAVMLKGKLKLPEAARRAFPDRLGSLVMGFDDKDDENGGSDLVFGSGEELETFQPNGFGLDRESDEDEEHKPSDDSDLRIRQRSDKDGASSVSVSEIIAADEKRSDIAFELSQKEINLEKLQRLASLGLPDGGGLRATAWKLLLGYLPASRDLWEKELTENRLKYAKLKEELLLSPAEYTRRKTEALDAMEQDVDSPADGPLTRQEISQEDHPLSLGKASAWHKYFQDTEIAEQIDRDLQRTHPDLKFFSGDSSLSRKNRENAEADSFCCFVRLLSDSVDHFCQQLDNSSVGIHSTLSRLVELLKANDEELWRHLEFTTKVNPQFYAFRWITLLLTQEFNFHSIMRIWDTLLSNTFGVQEMLLRVCCAMLLCIKSRLLSGDFAANLKLLQHYPEINIEHLLQVAQDLSPDTSSFRLSM